MSHIKQSLSWWCLAGSMTPEEIVSTAVQIGYKGIELAPEEHWPLIKEAGLTVVSINGHASISDGLNRRENHTRIHQELAANIEKAAKWKIPVLICFSGNRGGLDYTTGIQNTVEVLRSVAPLAEKAGVMLALELLNSKVDHIDYQCDHTAWGAEVIRIVDSPNVKLLYDIYHMQVMEGDIIATIRDNHVLIAHYHTAGVPGRHDIDDTQELNYLPIVHTILENGYRGYLGQEFVPKGDPLEAYRKAYQLCDISL